MFQKGLYGCDDPAYLSAIPPNFLSEKSPPFSAKIFNRINLSGKVTVRSSKVATCGAFPVPLVLPCGEMTLWNGVFSNLYAKD